MWWELPTTENPVRLVTGDCLEILRCMPDGCVDAVITDPPYGIGFDYASHDDSTEEWYELMENVVPHMRRVSKIAVMPACDQTRLGWWYSKFPPTWLIAWYKGSPGHLSHIGFNDWEAHLVWGKPPEKMHDHFQTPLVIPPNGHPCPKPVKYSTWLVTRMCPPGGIVLDPFMGSGTTGVACVRTGRRFVGIEIEPAYSAIAQRRVDEAMGVGTLFPPTTPTLAELFSGPE